MKWIEKIYYYFKGRYGRLDEFSKALVVTGLVVLALHYLLLSRWLGYIGIGFIAYGLLRPASKEIENREKELFAYQKFKGKLASIFRPVGDFFSRKKTKTSAYKAGRPSQSSYRKSSKATPVETSIVYCPHCQQKLRVPRGKTLMVTCTNCGHRFKQTT